MGTQTQITLDIVPLTAQERCLDLTALTTWLPSNTDNTGIPTSMILARLRMGNDFDHRGLPLTKGLDAHGMSGF